MRTPISWLVLAISILALPVGARAAAVISVTGGQASGSAYFTFQDAFDAQPLTPPVSGGIPGPPDSLGNYISMFLPGSRQGYIDFGANFANVVIQETWTAYRAYSSYDGSSPFASLWWSSSTDNVFDGGDVLETGLNFGTQNLPYNGQAVTWTQDYAGLSITPQARYLIVSGLDFANERATELAFVGAVVPEPSVMGLLFGASGLLLAIGRRRTLAS